MTAQFQINNVCDSDVHNAEKALITLLEFALVENLNGDNGRLLDVAEVRGERMKMNEFEGVGRAYISKLSFQ